MLKRTPNALAWLVTIAGALLALWAGLYLRQWLPASEANAVALSPIAPQPRLAQAPSAALLVADSAEITQAPTSIIPVPQMVNGVTVSAVNFRREGNRVKADVCYTMLTDADWTIWKASLTFGGREVTELGATMLERVPPTAGKTGQRCDELYFKVAPDEPMTKATLTIHSIANYPGEGGYCATMERAQKALNERSIAIVLKCTEENGVANTVIVSQPKTMTQAEVEALVFSDEWFTIQGPWVFTADIGQ